MSFYKIFASGAKCTYEVFPAQRRYILYIMSFCLESLCNTPVKLCLVSMWLCFHFTTSHKKQYNSLFCVCIASVPWYCMYLPHWSIPAWSSECKGGRHGNSFDFMWFHYWSVGELKYNASHVPHVPTKHSLTFFSLMQFDTQPKVTAGSKVIGQNILHIPCSRSILPCGMLKKVK